MVSLWMVVETFRVGDANGTRIAFDQSAGTLILSSSDFMLGSKGQW